MKICFIIDPIQTLIPKKDSSIDLMMEASARGYSVDFCEFIDIYLFSLETKIKTRSVQWRKDTREHAQFSPALAQIGAETLYNIQDYDVIFIRKDPPFDSHYYSLTLMLDIKPSKTLFVNSPKGVQAVSEKLSVLKFPDYAPPTLAAYDIEQLVDFAKQYEKVVVKPAYFGSGQGIVLTSVQDKNFINHLGFILDSKPHGPAIVQAFLPEVVDKGDVRVMVIEGKPIAAVARKPPEGDFRANIAIGGSESAVVITQEQKAIAEHVGEYLFNQGIIFAGLDFIGNKLIEINVTSPTLIQELRRVSGFDMSQYIFNIIEKKGH